MCFIGVMIIKLVVILFNTFLMLWVTSFKDSGVLESDEEAKSIIQTINIFAVVASLIFFKPAGIITDKYPAYVSIPIAFIWRALSIIAFCFINDPRSIYAYLVSVSLVVGTLFENTTVDGLFNKNLPKEIRGTLNGAYNFFGNIGILLFSKIGGILYDKVSPNAPFIIVCVCDVLFALLIIVLLKMKKFNQ